VATNGTVANFVAVSGSVYTFNLIPTAPGLVSANIAAGVAQDTATPANLNTAAPTFSRTYTTGGSSATATGGSGTATTGGATGGTTGVVPQGVADDDGGGDSQCGCASIWSGASVEMRLIAALSLLLAILGLSLRKTL
jgi:hypothetical protein